MSLMTRILKSSNNPYISPLMESEILTRDNLTTTEVPAMNIALAGTLSGGIGAGNISIAGESKHFKSLFALELAREYLKSRPQAELFFFDSEFGSPLAYFDTFGDDRDKILHIPVTSVENLRHQMTDILDKATPEDDVIFVVDSIGGLASLKEIKDAKEDNESVDMTRSKILKSFFRIVTPTLKIKDVPLITIQHTYQTLEKFSKKVMSGGTGGIYGADIIWFIGKQQVKEDTELVGWNFVINIEKSRFVKEKMKIDVIVKYTGGIYKYSGIFDLAVEAGVIRKPSKGYYSFGDDKKHRRSKFENDEEFMGELILRDDFKRFVGNKFLLNPGEEYQPVPVEESADD